jgi:hypothetical protein
MLRRLPKDTIQLSLRWPSSAWLSNRALEAHDAAMEKGYTVMQFRARCRACGESFPFPLVSDQESYGQFILLGERGRAYAYLLAIDNPAWDAIAALVSAATGHEKLDWMRSGERLQRVVAACADPIGGERLTIGPPICPHCQSRQVSYGDGEPMGVTELPIVSFARFMGLTPAQRAQEVTRLLQQLPPSLRPRQ